MLIHVNPQDLKRVTKTHWDTEWYTDLGRELAQYVLRTIFRRKGIRKEKANVRLDAEKKGTQINRLSNK